MKNSKKAVVLPLDRLTALWPRDLLRCRLGAVLHPASVSASLAHASEVLKSHDGALFRLSALFGPQHGYLGQTQDNMIEWRDFQHPRWGIPVYSLYGEHREPTQDMLAGLDALLIDMQDVGARYYTFIWTMYLTMKACEEAGKTVVVLDRPNPLNAVTVEGPLLNPAYKSFVGLHPIPVRHGKTIGQLAEQFKAEAFPRCDLRVLPMEGCDPEMFFDETGLPWVLPSPNMPTLETAIVYPGMCLFEATNVSEGRGTTRPFEIFGAPFINAHDLCAKLNRAGLPGAHFREAYFQPTFHKFHGQLCGGAQIHVVDRDAFLPWATALEIIRTLRHDYPKDFAWKPPPYEYEFKHLPIEVLIGGPVQDVFPDA